MLYQAPGRGSHRSEEGDTRQVVPLVIVIAIQHSLPSRQSLCSARPISQERPISMHFGHKMLCSIAGCADGHRGPCSNLQLSQKECVHLPQRGHGSGTAPIKLPSLAFIDVMVRMEKAWWAKLTINHHGKLQALINTSSDKNNIPNLCGLLPKNRRAVHSVSDASPHFGLLQRQQVAHKQ